MYWFFALVSCEIFGSGFSISKSLHNKTQHLIILKLFRTFAAWRLKFLCGNLAFYMPKWPELISTIIFDVVCFSAVAKLSSCRSLNQLKQNRLKIRRRDLLKRNNWMMRCDVENEIFYINRIKKPWKQITIYCSPHSSKQTTNSRIIYRAQIYKRISQFRWTPIVLNNWAKTNLKQLCPFSELVSVPNSYMADLAYVTASVGPIPTTGLVRFQL